MNISNTDTNTPRKATLIQRWPLFIVLLIFIACKAPHLYYPYYWDESWPYAPAIRQMYEHGISLVPGAVEGELSRGHPLFFHAIAALWMRIFGNSLFAMHSFALAIASLFLVVIYETGIRLFNMRVAVLALVLVASQEIFFVQSSFVLLEILLALLAFISLLFYVKQKYLLTIISLTALFYTKESGLVLGAVLGIDAAFSLLRKNGALKKNFLQLFSVFIPFLLIAVFFVLQKIINGWYVLPLYSNLIEHNWLLFWYKFRMACIRDVCYQNFKYIDLLLLLLLSLLATIKQKKIGYLVLWIPGIIIYYYVDDMRAGRLLPGIPFFIVFIISLWFMLLVFRRMKFYEHILQQKFIELSTCFIFLFLCFSATNFYTYRYMLAALVPLLFFAAFVLTKLSDLSFKPAYFAVIAAVLCTSAYAFRMEHSYGDTSLGAFGAMDVQSGVVNFFEKNVSRNKVIASGSFLEQQHLINPYTGFLHSDKAFPNVQWNINAATDYVIFDNIEPDTRYNEIKKDTSFKKLVRIQKDSLWAEIYLRK